MTDRDRLIELIYCAGRDYDDYVDNQHEMGMPAHEDFDEWLADELLANGVIVPPCKVGDKVYEIVEKIGKKGHWEEDKYFVDEWEENIIRERKFNLFMLASGDFGKTVFLTKEQAERELEKRCNNAR